MVGTTLCVGVIGTSFEFQLMCLQLIVSGMVHSGIGGGGFMLVRDSDGNYEAIGEH
jgi:gamma-glutamyltranspeptidase/glutathione hydrolase